MAQSQVRTKSFLLDRKELLKLIGRRRLLIEPLLSEKQVENIGVDLRLDCFFREFIRTERPYLTPADDSSATVLREIEVFRHSFFLQPGEFALGQSFEYISLPSDLLGLLNGRSSLGRMGLVVHATANVVDPGWRGHLVFELANLGTMPIELVPLMRVARLVFLRTNVVQEYSGSYLAQIRIPPPSKDKLVEAILARSRREARDLVVEPEVSELGPDSVQAQKIR